MHALPPVLLSLFWVDNAYSVAFPTSMSANATLTFACNAVEVSAHDDCRGPRDTRE
jgi:hypothetical protein